MNKILILAIDEMKQKNFIQAKLILESLITKDPYDIEALFRLGQCYCKMKNFEQAIDHFEKCVMIDPDYTKAYHALHCVYGKAGILQKAPIDGEPIGFKDISVYLDRVILFLTDINNRCPDIPEVMISLGKALEKKKDFESAGKCYKRIIVTNKNQQITKLAKEALVKIRVREIIEKGKSYQ